MKRVVAAALAFLAVPAVYAQDGAPEPVDFMIRPSQDALPAISPADEDIWAPLDGETESDQPETQPPETAQGDLQPEPGQPVRRPALRNEDEPDPFEPVGVHLGTFIIRPSIEIGVSATDNADGGEDKDGVVGLLVAPALTARSDWSRHAIEADIRGTLIHYGDEAIDVREGSARLAGRYDISRNTVVDAEASYRLDLETYSDPDTPAAAVQRPANHTLNANVGLTHRFNRLSVRVGAEAERETHEEVDLAGGGVDERSDLDYLRTGLRLRAAVEAGPALTPFVEVAGGRKDFDEAVDTSGYRRSSQWGELRGGLLIDLGPKTAGEVSLGYYHESPEDDRLEDLSGLVANAALVWSPRRLTTVRFELATDVSPTSIAGASGSFIYSGRVTVARQLRHKLRIEAGLGIEHERFVGSDLRETTYAGFGGVSYALSRSAAIQARFEHERSNSSVPGSDEVIDTVSVRLRLQR